jgi:hypothetical protein
MVEGVKKGDACKIVEHNLSPYRSQLLKIAEEIIETCNDRECYTHVDYEPIPSRECVVEIIDRLREILFPGYFTRGKLDPVNLRYSMGQSAATVFDLPPLFLTCSRSKLGSAFAMIAFDTTSPAAIVKSRAKDLRSGCWKKFRPFARH